MNRRVWIARAAVGLVFAVNVWCAAAFILYPQAYAPAFELEGAVGRVMVQSLGILFLMWNATYPPVLWNPQRHRTLFGVVLAQQVIGVAGETALLLTLPPGHAALYATGLRFVVFDGAALVLLVLSYGMTVPSRIRK